MAGFDPSVISQIPDGLPNPAGAKQQAYTLAGQIDEQKLNHLKLQQSQQGMADQNTARNILKDNPIDFSKPETLTKAAEKISKAVSPEYAMKFMRQTQDVLGGQYENQIKQLQVAQEESNVVSQAVDPLVTKLMDMQRAGATPAMLNAASRAESHKAIQNLLESNPKMKPKIDALMKANPQGLDFDTLKTIDMNSKQGMALYKERLATYGQQDKDRKTDIQQQRANDMQQNLLSMEKARADREKNKAAGVMEPEDVHFRVGQYMAGDKSATTGLGSLRSDSGMKNWAAFNKDLRVSATQAAKEIGLDEKDAPKYVAAKIAEFEGAKAEERARGTREAAISIAATEATNMSKIALEKSKAVPRGDFIPWSELDQKFDKYANNKPLAQLHAATQSYINIYARAINPTGVSTVDAKQHAREMLYEAQNQDVYAGVIETLNQEVEQAKAAPDQVKESIMNSIIGSKVKTKDSSKDSAAPKKSYKGLWSPTK